MLFVRADDDGACLTALPSTMTRNRAYLILTILATMTYAVAAYAGLWIAPQTLRVSAPEAYSQFGGGSIFGIVMYAVIWTIWSAGSLGLVIIRVRKSDAWTRRGRHRFISLLANALMVAGLVAFGSWTSLLEVDLAAEHVMMSMNRDRNSFVPIVVVSMSGLCAIAASLVFGALGAGVDRIVGKAAFTVA
jgi:hypothetical protein